MKNNLEINDIAPYIGYGLNFYCEDRESGEYEILGLSKIDLSMEIIEIGSCDYSLDNIGNDSKGVICKPILRPIEDLTMEITYKGDTFVPIVELAKIGTREENCYITNGNIGTCYVDAKFQRKGFFIYHPQGYFMWQVGKNGDPLTVWNQKALFEKLYELHFDVNDLIGRGLAINLNEVDNGK